MCSRPIPSPWHVYKDELMKLDLQRVSFIEDARRMLNGVTLSVSRLYSITGVDWLIAASINFSSTTALRFTDLEGLPSNNTMAPVNARPLQEVRLNHDEGNREERPGRFLVTRAPIGQHVKMFRQVSSPPGHVKENNRQEAPMREQLRKLDCLKDLDLFETMCKILNIPMEVKKIWARKRLMPWFRANMTAWLYEYAKKHISKHGRVYSEYQLDIGAGAFKRALVTHRNAVTTAVKRISRTSEPSGKEKVEMLKEDLERNVTLCLHNSFYRNRESNVDPVPCCKQRVEEQKCWRTASNSVRIANDVLQDTETESAESVSQEEEMEH